MCSVAQAKSDLCWASGTELDCLGLAEARIQITCR
jgi:hypothetical protein